MKLIIGSDRSGFPLKEAVRLHLEEKGVEIIDVGIRAMEEFRPFFEVAPKAAAKLAEGAAEKAILFCGTGAGMAMVVNKCRGAYAVVCESLYTARMSRIINNANVLCLGGWVIAPTMGLVIADEWLATDFTQDLPQDRVEFLGGAYQNVLQVEKDNMK